MICQTLKFAEDVYSSLDNEGVWHLSKAMLDRCLNKIPMIQYAMSIRVLF